MRTTTRGSRVAFGVVAIGLALLLSACLTTDQQAGLDVLNRDRRAHGLGTLPAQDALTRKAQAWADKLARDGRLSHSALTAGVPACGDRGIGENVGMGGSLGAIETAWMRSAGHKANILGRWTDVGVGVARRGGQVYAVQVFRRCG